MPNLERLSLDDLKQLQKKLLYITEAGEVLRGWQFDPVFDLSPGQSPMIHLTGYTMPHAWTADEAETTAAPARDDAPESHQSPLPILSDDEWLTLRTDLEAGLDPYDLPKLALGHARRAGVSVEAIHAAYQHLQNNPYLFPLPAAAIEEFRADAPAMQDALCEKAKAMDDGWEHTPNREPYQFNARNPARDAAADAAAYGYNPGIGRFPIGASVPPIFSIVTEADSVEPPAPPPPAATPSTPSRPWTADEDNQLISLAVANVMAGMTIKKAHMRAGLAIGRPGEGASYRLYTKLKDRFATALQAAGKAAFDARPDKDEILGGEPGGLQRDRLAEKAPASPAAPQEATPQAAAGDGQAPADLDPAILRHLDQMPATSAGAKWPPKVDLDLVDAAARGLSLPEIATDLRLRADQAKLRLALLLGKFSAQDILRHMQARTQGAQA
jgi:hypothetical protein